MIPDRIITENEGMTLTDNGQIREPINVLLAEDDKESGQAVKIALEKRDCRVTIVSSGEDGLAGWQSRHFDIIVADIRLKGISGVDLLEKIRKTDSEFPVILLTGFDSLQTAVSAVKLGAQDYLLKPLDNIEDLVVPMRRAVGNHKLYLKNRALEAKLSESELRFRTVLENSADIIYRVNLAGGNIDYISPAVDNVLGYTQVEIEGMKADELTDLIHPEDRGKLPDIPREFTDSRVKTYVLPPYECRVRKKSGEYVWLGIRQSVVCGDGGVPISVIGSARDMSDQKLSEEHQRQLQERLTRVERMETITILASGIAHDLNNMLMPILGIPDLMLSELDKKAAPDLATLRGNLKDIRESAKNAAAMIRDLLTLSRRGKYAFEPVNLNDVIREYLESRSFKSLAAANPLVKATSDLSTDLKFILGSEHHLARVVANIVANAFEVLPAGGNILIRTSNQTVNRAVAGYELIEQGDYAVMRVSDSGRGFGKSDINRLFEPFWSKKKMKDASGSGLGLAVVHGVVKDHKGFIDVVTGEGKGTEFIFYFPTTSEKKKKNEEEEAVELKGSEAILYVDDNREQLKLAARYLETLGYRFVAADSGRMALTMLKEKTTDGTSPFHLVILDMIMEDGFDGLETYREILKICPGQKCIIVSGHFRDERAAEAEKLGAGLFINKPFTMRMLGRAVRTVLDNLFQGRSGNGSLQ